MLKLIDSNEMHRKKIDAIYRSIDRDLSILSVQQLEERIRRISLLAIKILNSK